MLVEVSMSALRASAGISSGPSALPPFRAFMAFLISVLVGGLQFLQTAALFRCVLEIRNPQAKERQERQRGERERARDPVAIVAKIGKD